MLKFSRAFNGHRIRMIRMGEMNLYSAYDITVSLGIENKRRAVNEVVINEHGKHVNFVQWETDNVLFLSEDYIVALCFTVNKELAKEFLMWMVEIESVAARFEDKEDKLSPIYNGETYDRSNHFAITQVAKRYGLSGKQLNEILNQMMIQHKVNDQWVLYAKYQQMDLVKVIKIRKNSDEEDFVFHTYWTVKGVSFIERILERAGYHQQGEQLKLL